jgi:mRNA interferase MazF
LKQGDIILINFPFTNPVQTKLRPAVIITETKDKYQDLIVCAISSVVPEYSSEREIIIKKDSPFYKKTGLRADSVIKIDRLATLRKTDIVMKIGECPAELWKSVAQKFKSLVKKG